MIAGAARSIGWTNEKREPKTTTSEEDAKLFRRYKQSMEDKEQAREERARQSRRDEDYSFPEWETVKGKGGQAKGKGKGKDGKGKGEKGKAEKGKGKEKSKGEKGARGGGDKPSGGGKGSGLLAITWRGESGEVDGGGTKRDREGKPKVGAMAFKAKHERGFLKIGFTSRWFKESDIIHFLTTCYGIQENTAKQMCLPCGMDSYDGAALCPCPQKEGHETHDSWAHRFPKGFAKHAREMLRGEY